MTSLSLTDMLSTLKINLDNGNLNLNEDINKIIAKIRYVGNLKKDLVMLQYYIVVYQMVKNMMSGEK